MTKATSGFRTAHTLASKTFSRNGSFGLTCGHAHTKENTKADPNETSSTASAIRPVFVIASKVRPTGLFGGGHCGFDTGPPLQSSRNAAVTGIVAARTAGKIPPIRPMASAHFRPSHNTPAVTCSSKLSLPTEPAAMVEAP